MQTTSYEETLGGVRLLRAPIPAGDDQVFVERAAEELSGMIDGSPAHWPLVSLVLIQRTDELLCFTLFGADDEVLRDRFDALLGQAPAQQLAITTWAISDVTGEEIACLYRRSPRLGRAHARHVQISRARGQGHIVRPDRRCLLRRRDKDARSVA